MKYTCRFPLACMVKTKIKASGQKIQLPCTMWFYPNPPHTHTHKHTLLSLSLSLSLSHTHTDVHYACANVTLIMLIVNHHCFASAVLSVKRLQGRVRSALKAAFSVF